MKNGSKIRFKQNNFKDRLKYASKYKRPVKKPASGFFADILKLLQISKVTGFFILLVIIGLFYLIYLPNFLTVKEVQIFGVKEQNTSQIKAYVNKYFSSHRIFAQKNLVFLRKNKLQTYLEKNSEVVLKITNIKKVWFGKLEITIEERQNKFLIGSPEEIFLASQDGLLRKTLGNFSSTSSPEKLTEIKLSSFDGQYQANQKIPQTWLLPAAENTSVGIKNITGSDVLYFSLETPDSLTLSAFLDKNVKINFDLGRQTGEQLENLKLLWENLDSSQKNQLKYIDLTIKNRGYVCFLNSVCAQEKKPALTETSTPESLK